MPGAVIEGLSGNGPQAFLQGVLGPDTHSILSDISWTHNQVSESVYRGVRLAQDVAYCRNWDFFVPLVIKEDPFGRSKSRVANSLSTFSLQAAVVGGFLMPLAPVSSPDWCSTPPADLPPEFFEEDEDIVYDVDEEYEEEPEEE